MINKVPSWKSESYFGLINNTLVCITQQHHPSVEEPLMNRIGIIFYSRIKKTEKWKVQITYWRLLIRPLEDNFHSSGQSLGFDKLEIACFIFLFLKLCLIGKSSHMLVANSTVMCVFLWIGMVVGDRNGSLPSHHLQPRWLEYLRFRWDPNMLISHVKMSTLKQTCKLEFVLVWEIRNNYV